MRDVCTPAEYTTSEGGPRRGESRTCKPSKSLLLHLDPAGSGEPLVLGPFRVVQFAPDGIYVSAAPAHPLHLAVSMAGRFVLLMDGSEWAGARLMAMEDGGAWSQAEAS